MARATFLHPALFVLLLIFNAPGFAQDQPEEDAQLDPLLFGTWEGSQKDQFMIGHSSEWIQERFPDGTFILIHISMLHIDGEMDIQKGSEKGRWWIKDGLFYEYHQSSGLTDIYEYEVLNNEQVRFKSRVMSLPTVNGSYEFIDFRVPDL